MSTIPILTLAYRSERNGGFIKIQSREFIALRSASRITNTKVLKVRMSCVSAMNRQEFSEIGSSDVQLLNPIGKILIQTDETQIRKNSQTKNWFLFNGISNATVFSVNVYAAVITRGNLKGRQVLLKEYPPPSSGLAVNEILTQKRFRETKEWATTKNYSPFLNLFGHFKSEPLINSPFEDGSNNGQSYSEGEQSTWLAFKFEPLFLASMFPGQKQSQRSSFLDLFNPFETVFPAQKAKFLKKVIRRSIEALNYIHIRGIVHSGINLNCILLSTFDQWQADNLEVKLTNFGLSKEVNRLSAETLEEYKTLPFNSSLDALAVSRQIDIHHLGLSLLELIFNSFSEKPLLSVNAIQNIWVKIHDCDPGQVQTYFQDFEEHQTAAYFLGEMDGWDFFSTMLRFPTPEADKLLLMESIQD